MQALLGPEIVDFDVLDDRLVWLERRPARDGLQVLVEWRDGTAIDLDVPGGVKDTVRGYGSGSFCLSPEGVYAVCQKSGSLLYLTTTNKVEVRADIPGTKIGGLVYHPYLGRLFFLGETADGENCSTGIYSYDPISGQCNCLWKISGFIAQLAPSKNSASLAWIAWPETGMPHDATSLWVGDFLSEMDFNVTELLPAVEGRSICQPYWNNGDSLWYLNDASGFWALEEYSDGKTIPVAQLATDMGFLSSNMLERTFTQVSDGRLFCAVSEMAEWHLSAWLPVGGSNKAASIDTNNAAFVSIRKIKAYQGGIALLAGSRDRPISVWSLQRDADLVRLSADTQPDAQLPVAEFRNIIFEVEPGLKGNAFYYETSKTGKANARNQLPLVVNVHGGPKAMATADYSATKAFWLEQGYCFLDVNYRGSLGLGRRFRQAINGKWGIADVQDVCACVQEIVSKCHIDPKRIVVRGASAGGLTVVLLLAQSSLFAAGSSHYGVLDLLSLAKTTHSYEKHYLESLVGCTDQDESVYRDRSPTTYAAALKAPLLLLQGLKDQIVPPSQAYLLSDLLAKHNMPYQLIEFENDGHGWATREATLKALEAESCFYEKILGF
ncbi:prolyl oligopeptidase family serine peptidase [Kordiimonas lipolytica]|uniref:Prolyl oligopeptidase family serine peptidase n=1 Tax=Kordiimonas lipolytica TaxID=1662421 RepID=A0ABV8UG64_9PROT|nr:prolyl oligopeptidase family serine peptidase [Kordiimonas lipolytica]